MSYLPYLEVRCLVGMPWSHDGGREDLSYYLWGVTVDVDVAVSVAVKMIANVMVNVIVKIEGRARKSLSIRRIPSFINRNNNTFTVPASDQVISSAYLLNLLAEGPVLTFILKLKVLYLVPHCTVRYKVPGYMQATFLTPTPSFRHVTYLYLYLYLSQRIAVRNGPHTSSWESRRGKTATQAAPKGRGPLRKRI